MRAARNFYEQNVVLQLEEQKTGIPYSSASLCSHESSNRRTVGPIRFIVSKVIEPGDELLAWPDLNLVLTAHLPILTLTQIKGALEIYFCEDFFVVW